MCYFIPALSAAKEMASTIETKWRKMIKDANNGVVTIKSEGGASAASLSPAHRRLIKPLPKADAASKKRKIDIPPSSKAGPPTKKPAVGSASAAKPAPTITKKVVPATSKTTAKSDISFFTSKPKTKMPSFKKDPPSVSGGSKDSETATAQASAIDPFQEAMRLMEKKSGSPAPNAPREATPSTSTATVTAVILGKNGKPKKRVTFPLDDALEQVKFIERAVYDDDLGEGAHHSSYRDLDIDEGHALHATLFEEQLDWYSPSRKFLALIRGDLSTQSRHPFLQQSTSRPKLWRISPAAQSVRRLPRKRNEKTPPSSRRTCRQQRSPILLVMFALEWMLLRMSLPQ